MQFGPAPGASAAAKKRFYAISEHHWPSLRAIGGGRLAAAVGLGRAVVWPRAVLPVPPIPGSWRSGRNFKYLAMVPWAYSRRGSAGNAPCGPHQATAPRCECLQAHAAPLTCVLLNIRHFQGLRRALALAALRVLRHCLARACLAGPNSPKTAIVMPRNQTGVDRGDIEGRPELGAGCSIGCPL